MKSILKVFTSFRMFIVLLLGFSSGLPLALTAGTMQAWLTDAKIDITQIGMFALVGLPYALKMAWSPIMDRYSLFGLGRRRGWLILSQVGLVASIILMGIIHPELSIETFAVMATLVAFFSASQDIVIDAYRTEVLSEEELGVGAGIYVMGYRIAMLVSGGVALAMADKMPWTTVYFVMSLCMAIGLIASFFGPEPENKEEAPKTLAEAYYRPLVEYFKRSGAIEMLIFILIYKVDVAFAMALTTNFMMSLGFTKTDVAAVLKGAGLFATIGGTLVGGAFMSKYGIKKSLWTFGIIQGISGATFYLLAHVGYNYPLMVASITIENFCSGLATAAFTAFMMRIVDKRFTAAQYALLTSFMALTRIMVQTPSGFVQKAWGWEIYFIISVVISIPGLLLLLRYDKWQLDHV